MSRTKVLTQSDIVGPDINAVRTHPRFVDSGLSDEFIETVQTDYEFYAANQAIGPIIGALSVMAQREGQIILSITADTLIITIPIHDQSTMDIQTVFYRTAFSAYYVSDDPAYNPPLGRDDVVAREYVLDSASVLDVCNGFQVKPKTNILTMGVKRQQDGSVQEFTINNMHKKTKIGVNHIIPIVSTQSLTLRKISAIGETDPTKYSIVMSIDSVNQMFTKFIKNQQKSFAINFTPQKTSIWRVTPNRGRWSINLDISPVNAPSWQYRSIGAEHVTIDDVRAADIIVHKRLISSIQSIWISEPIDTDTDRKKCKIQCRYNFSNDYGFMVYERWA